MTIPEPLGRTATDLGDLLYRLAREWQSVEEEVEDQDEQDALHRALEEGYPFGGDLDELQAQAAAWAEHVQRVMAARPTVLQLVVKEMSDDIDKVDANLTDRDARTPTDDAYRVWQNGGLGGEIGRFGGIFTPSIAAGVRDLLQAVEGGDLEQIARVADRFGRDYRNARKTSTA